MIRKEKTPPPLEEEDIGYYQSRLGGGRKRSLILKAPPIIPLIYRQNFATVLRGDYAACCLTLLLLRRIRPEW